MAEFASNGKGNLGVTLGAIGTGLGVLGNGLGGLFNGFGYNNPNMPEWVSKEEFNQRQKISSLESENALLRVKNKTLKYG